MRDARCQWCRRGLRERRRAERQYARVARGTQGDETPLCSRLRFGRAESPHTFSSTSTSCKSRRERSRAEGREEVRCQDGASYSSSQSVIYFTVPPRAAHPTSLCRRVFPFLKIASRVLIQTLASIAQLWIQHSLTVTPRSSARLFSLSINIERRSGPESGVDCRRSPPPGASANREPCLRTFPEARTPRSVLHGVNTHTLAPQTENTLIMLLVPGRDISAIGCPSAGGKRVDTVTSVYSTVGGLPILADP